MPTVALTSTNPFTLTFPDSGGSAAHRKKKRLVKLPDNANEKQPLWGVPAVALTSTNPFTLTFTDGGGSAAHRKKKQLVKLPDNADEKQPYGEYLMHFERSAIIYGWQEDMVMFLAAVKPDRRK